MPDQNQLGNVGGTEAPDIVIDEWVQDEIHSYNPNALAGMPLRGACKVTTDPTMIYRKLYATIFFNYSLGGPALGYDAGVLSHLIFLKNNKPVSNLRMDFGFLGANPPVLSQNSLSFLGAGFSAGGGLDTVFFSPVNIQSWEKPYFPIAMTPVYLTGSFDAVRWDIDYCLNANYVRLFLGMLSSPYKNRG